MVAGLLAILGVSPGSSSAVVWSPLGPYGGTVGALVIDPGDPAVVYAATRTGVWKTTDGGASWKPSSNGMSDFWIRALAIDPSAPQTIYAAATDGTYRSTDGGARWNRVTGGSDTLVVAPSEPQTVYAGSSRSTDGGSTWDEMLGAQVGALAVDPSDANTVYASTPAALLKSLDGGDTWSALDVPNPWVGSIAVDPLNPNRVYLADGQISRSEDAGATWTTVPTPAGMLLYYVGIAQSAPNTVYASGRSGALSAMTRSDDGGDTWEALQQIPGGTLPAHFAIDPTAEAVVYGGTFGHGVWKTTDSGQTFAESNQGLAAEPAHDLDFDPTDPMTAYVSLGYGGGFRTDDGGASWTRIDSELSLPDEDAFIQSFAVDSASTVYVARSPGDIGVPPILASNNGGSDWHGASGSIPDGSMGRSLYADPRTPGLVFALVEDDDSWPRTGGLYETTDGGDQWSNVSPSPSAITAAVFEPDTNRIVISAGLSDESPSDGLFVSDDWGLTWDRRLMPPFPLASLTFGATPDTIYAGSQVSSEIAVSHDGGESWSVSKIDETNYSSGISAIAVDPADSSVVYAGTAGGGLWYSDDTGDTWSAVTPGARDSYVPVIVFAPETPSDLARTASLPARVVSSQAPVAYAGMSGRGRGGLWRLTPPPHSIQRPPLTGEATVGQRVACGRGKWSRATTFAYRWLRDRRPIKDADGARYRVRVKDRGHKLACRVTAFGPGGHRAADSRSVRAHR